MANPIGLEPRSPETLPTGPSHSDIAALAYQIWSDRGCPIGSPDEDWFQAEKELSRRDESAAMAA